MAIANANAPSCPRVDTQTPARSPSHGETSRSQLIGLSFWSLAFLLKKSSSFFSGLEVPRSLPAAASAFSRRRPRAGRRPRRRCRRWPGRRRWVGPAGRSAAAASAAGDAREDEQAESTRRVARITAGPLSLGRLGTPHVVASRPSAPPADAAVSRNGSGRFRIPAIAYRSPSAPAHPADGAASMTQAAVQNGDLHTGVQADGRSRRTLPTANALHKHRFGASACRLVVRGGTNVGKGVARWGNVGYNTTRQPVRGGGAPPTPPPRIDRAPVLRTSMRLGLPRHVRTHAGRQAPAHGAVEVPRGAVGARRAGQGGGPLRLGVSGRDLRGDDAGGARRAEPVLAAGAASSSGCCSPTRPTSSSTRRAA